ncbi:head-tail adaptor protein [Cereibacter sphaeroides]|uniref:phage head closure protein n=1 Tax=Cereibacter sphaeroides TaxID=1063 RepID=UPI000F527EE5|nr:phage head closure protein [Cereibacter sphaeroides]AZB65035.1 head-tail adaptor protein [Cereibacter sphaeroides]AZB67081.1 head-tail adaptor protein [Cereibacter sphaeroides]
MKAEKLDRRIQFRRAAPVDDGFAEVETWSDHGSPVWAARADLSDGERWRAAEVAAGVTTRFTVRWSAFAAAITPKDRLLCDGREFDITGIKEPPETRRQWIEITAAARID